MAETEYSAATATPGLIVNDARKAMSLLSAAFYGYPQNELTVIGVTGTKGKTTTSYFTQALINAVSGGKAALFSSVDNCLDGHTYVESDLTTPESMDAFRMMREAADNGMKYLVMEVSSQAYKVDRVYGLTFDVAAFLNISPTTSARSNTPRSRITCIASARSSSTRSRWYSARTVCTPICCGRTRRQPASA